jgi:branched-chain amino acid transport system ATP-binding protein
MSHLFELIDINAGYGEFKVLHGVTMSVEERNIVSLIGSNGAGKTTLLKTISGLVKVDSGKIFFNSCDLTQIPSYEITQMGIVQVPEGRRIFSKMTVEENLLVVVRSKLAKRHQNETLRQVFGIFPILEERFKQRAGTLSGGEQQMLAVARALMAKPELLMLDELSSGLAPLIAKELFNVIRRLNKDQGITIFLVEQNIKEALNLSDFGYVLENGKIVLRGTGQELLNNEETKKAYIGG